MRRSSEAVTRRAYHNVEVIWAGTPKTPAKNIVVLVVRRQGSLSVNTGLKIMSDVESWFNFVTSDGSKTSWMQSMLEL